MKNFSTNQTRFLYVLGAVKDTAAAVTSNLDMAAVGDAAKENFKLVYKNADGIVVGSDSFKKSQAEISITSASALRKPIMSHTVDVANYTGTAVNKVVDLVVTIHEAFDYTSTKTFSVAASAANAATLAKTLAVAIAKAQPIVDKNYPYIKVYYNNVEVTKSSTVAGLTGTITKFELRESPQKFILGKLSREACPVSVAFRPINIDGEDVIWGTDTYAKSTDTISGSYELAELEYFAAGEKGDFLRGSAYPADFTFTPAISIGTEYDVLNISYYTAGDAEDSQKSPRLIQVAGSAANIKALKAKFDAAASA